MSSANNLEKNNETISQNLPKLLVIIPTYNEKQNIEQMINKVMSLPLNCHLLIVDDNSPDGTADIVINLQQKYFQKLHLLQRKEKNGLGRAYLAGFRWALERDYDLIGEMDADFSHNPDDLARLAEACQNADLAIGSRYIQGVNVINWPMKRLLISYFGSVYVRLITAMPIMDTTAGFKMYRRQTLEQMALSRINLVGYGFQIAMKFIAYKQGFNLVEVPIVFTERTLGTSKMSNKIIKEALWGVMWLRIESFFRKYPKVK